VTNRLKVEIVLRFRNFDADIGIPPYNPCIMT